VKLAALALLCSIPVSAATASAEAYQSKKDRERATKTTQHPPVLAPGSKPDKLVNLFNEHTHDWLAVDATDLPNESAVDTLLRDHFTNMETKMDPRLIGIAISAAKQFKSDLVTVVSGFRHPKFNLMLRKKGHQVARDSQHTHGNALDFSLPTCSTQQLEKWAKAQKVGGVGVYLESGFVHMDTGPIRTWSGE
jgi:uncharacterized protein YcbK (DUF882 family)